MAIGFAVGAVNINSQMTNAGAAFGANQLNGWSAHRKTDNGVGQMNGIFVNSANLTIIIDNDLNDGIIIDPDVTPAVQGQAV